MDFSFPDSTDSTDTDPKRTQIGPNTDHPKGAKKEPKRSQNGAQTDTKRTQAIENGPDPIEFWFACDSDGSMSKINGKTNGFFSSSQSGHHRNGLKTEPKQTQNGPKTDPKRTRNGSKTQPNDRKRTGSHRIRVVCGFWRVHFRK